MAGGAVRCERRGPEETRKTKNTSWKAPGLHSPAALLAVLIIAHTDRDTVTKFRKYISGLQIDWMVLQNRQALHVRDGFWEGVDSNNLHTIFATEVIEVRRKEAGLLLDYDSIFGRNFVACRKDIRPFVHSIALDPLYVGSL